ncbi:MAG: DUF91 domain-containing protein [Candidatus Diapherotrites archaeon]|uniref:Endonuclease NucS n=1 Tax=Candidatus Iainarchaeum sp. TaxID=3101447 RepID=A0A8T3YMH5_9ARCH|nr:DUF91 domain-containing protein [Candidatus Diapherotrites archaeon]
MLLRAGTKMDFSQLKAEIEGGVLSKDMMVIVGTCSVDYEGRATSRLPMGKRLVLIKGDNSISIHQNRLVRPTNYMMDTQLGCKISDGAFILRANKAKPAEKLTLTFTEVHDMRRYAIERSDDLRLSGSERDLNDLLMQDLSMIEPGLEPVNQQQHFRKGICDIIARDKDGNFVVIELKRRQADFDSVTQLHRYMHEVENMKGVKARGILLAPDIRKNARELLGQLGLEFARLDFELTPNGREKAKIKGLEMKQQRITQHMGTGKDYSSPTK